MKLPLIIAASCCFAAIVFCVALDFNGMLIQYLAEQQAIAKEEERFKMMHFNEPPEQVQKEWDRIREAADDLKK